MAKDYSGRNLQKTIFRNRDLSAYTFLKADLRGADFTGADLSGVDLREVKTGIPLVPKILLFAGAVFISLFSGYIAMLAGTTLQYMINDKEEHVRWAAILSLVLIILFLVYCIWKGIGKGIKYMAFPFTVLALLLALTFYATNMGTGRGMFYLSLSLALVAIMFAVGTIARTVAGSLSNILFIIVAMSGAAFGRSLGGGIGTIVLATACVLISKRALKGAPGFEGLHYIVEWITAKFGTSFREANLRGANFSGAHLSNTDFTGADLEGVLWEEARKINLVFDTETSTSIKAIL